MLYILFYTLNPLSLTSVIHGWTFLLLNTYYLQRDSLILMTLYYFIEYLTFLKPIFIDGHV